MLKIDQNKAQAIVELAVFGAILIYIIGTIIRTAAGNSLTQNENFKAMRLAMLESWTGAINSNISRNSASVIVMEDRLSPDFNKYGSLDRTPYMANGSGTFSYELLYPLTPGQDNMQAQMPALDVFINGQHFVFTTAQYIQDKTLVSPVDGYPPCVNPDTPSSKSPIVKQTLSPSECQYNQCLRYTREWIGGLIYASQFNNVIVPVNVVDPTCTVLATTPVNLQNLCQANLNGIAIFDMLAQAPGNLIDQSAAANSTQGKIDPIYTSSTTSADAWNNFTARYAAWYSTYFPSPPYPASQSTAAAIKAQLANIKQRLDSVPATQYKLFYAIVANMIIPGAAEATPVYSVNAPTCASHPCKDQELSSDRCLTNADGTKLCNSGSNNGDLMFDLQRNNIPYGQPGSSVVPSSAELGSNTSLRPYMAWQWAATAGTTSTMIGLVTSNGQFPQYDIDGRLNEVTLYSIAGPNTNGEVTVSYSDPELGDFNSAWDINSCGPRPGIQSDAQVFTFTQNGTYLQIKEGQMLNPETGQVVRSQTKHDTIDLIQRMVQMSNNTGRFCGVNSSNSCSQDCLAKQGSCVTACKTDSTCIATCGTAETACASTCANPDPVEVCIAPNQTLNGKTVNCFSSEMNIKSTCYDENNNMLYVRSRLQDLRGHLWMTATSGQLKVQK